jgi:hypothetical protein
VRSGEQLIDAARRIESAARAQGEVARQLSNASERLRRTAS